MMWMDAKFFETGDTRVKALVISKKSVVNTYNINIILIIVPLVNISNEKMEKEKMEEKK